MAWINCAKCEKKLYANYIRDIDNTVSDESYCDEHIQEAENELKQLRFLEQHSGVSIYHKVDSAGQVRFYPDWQSMVFYYTVYWARDYIDRNENSRKINS